MHKTSPIHVIVMGVSGSGKSTVAGQLHARTGFPFAEADDFHSEANIAKMAAGIPLTDEDRWPWLHSLRSWMWEQERYRRSSIITCSALKRSYRKYLAEPSPFARASVLFVDLHGSPEILRQRLERRRNHFMGANMLESQLAALEPLQPDENFITLDIADTIRFNVNAVIKHLYQIGALSPTRRR
ncbi:MAG: gluconokinase [Corynebacterium sp.]|nr:gluconokinase [Corynebacterium sp.]